MPPHATADHRPCPAERLDHDAAHPLRARRQDEEGRLVERKRHLGLRQPLAPGHLIRKVAREALHDRPESARADEAQPRSRHPCRCATPCLGEAVDVLVALENADEERLGVLRERLRR